MARTSRTPMVSRRDMLKVLAAGAAGASSSGWMEALANETANHPQRRRACILLWMNGGPSQMDTFDLKPGHANGGPIQEIQTSVPGIRISEHLPRVARNMQDMALLRTMTSREGDHARGTFLMRTGYLPQGAIQFPSIGSLISKELGSADAPLPNFVSISPYRQFSPAAYGSGFLGPQYAPLLVGDMLNPFVQQQGQNNYDQALRVQDLEGPADVSRPQMDARVALLEDMQREFVAQHPGVAGPSHQSAYDRAVRLMRTSASTAFNLEEEPSRLRDSYGRNQFGQGCLLARRLVERGVPFIEVNLTSVPGVQGLGWDTHINNFDAISRLSQVLDPAWGTLMEDLRQRGLLESTLIVWMGEFGRTPRINPQRGRDHWPNVWTTVLAGGGIRGGTTFGSSGPDGMAVTEGRAVPVPDFLATVCRALGIDPTRQNMSNVGRPIRIVDNVGRAVSEVLPA